MIEIILADRLQLLRAWHGTMSLGTVSFIKNFASAHPRIDRNADPHNDRLAKQTYRSHFRMLYYGNISGQQHLSLIIVVAFV